ncbi:MAG: S41 family peptidase [Pseudomonadota bacterium]
MKRVQSSSNIKARATAKAFGHASTLALGTVIGGALTAALLTAGFARSAFDAETFRQLDLFGEAFEAVHRNYVEEPKDAELMEGAIEGMLSSLDPHSSYLPPSDLEIMQETTRGTFGGLGIQVTQEREGIGRGLVRVISPMDGTPAARAGIEPGDLIFEIDGESVFGMSLTEATDLMKGEKGTNVTLRVAREDVNEPLEFELERDIIVVNPVVARVERGNFGYLRVGGFTQQTEKKMLEAIKEMEEESGGLAGLVIDVRNNPGGLLDQAVAVSEAFLDGGEIVSTRGRHSKDSMREIGKRGDVLEGRPIVVLVNGGSASASEIVAGALQDRNRGLILGTKTFGKGSVQTILPLDRGGRSGALRLTTARYYTPSGRSIQAEGIVPDIVMPITRPGQEEPAERRSERDLEGALDVENEDVPTSDATTVQEILMEGQEALAEREREEENATALFIEPTECPVEEDCQLNRALDLLEDRSRFGQLLADAGAIQR